MKYQTSSSSLSAGPESKTHLRTKEWPVKLHYFKSESPMYFKEDWLTAWLKDWLNEWMKEWMDEVDERISNVRKKGLVQVNKHK